MGKAEGSQVESKGGKAEPTALKTLETSKQNIVCERPHYKADTTFWVSKICRHGGVIIGKETVIG